MILVLEDVGCGQRSLDKSGAESIVDEHVHIIGAQITLIAARLKHSYRKSYSGIVDKFRSGVKCRFVGLTYIHNQY
jgi:hypothetical protein